LPAHCASEQHEIRWAGAAVCALVVAAPAQAAWSPPVRLGRPAQYPDIVMARDGHALVTAFSSRDDTQLITLAPGGVEPIVRRTVSGRPWFRTYGRNGTIGFRASDGVVFGTITDPLSRAEPVAGAWDLGVSPRGDAVAMWGERRGRDLLTRYALRPPGGHFGRPRTIAVGHGYDAYWGSTESGETGTAAAIDGDGNVTIALLHESGQLGKRRREVRVVTVRRGMRPGPQQVLGPHHGSAAVELAVAAGGRTVIAWKSSDLGEEVNLPTEVWAATRRPGSRRFRRAQRLEGNGSAPIVSSGYLDLATGADGEALVAWSATSRSGHPLVEAASARPGRRFGAVQRVAADGIEVAVALARDGRATITWVSSQEPQSGIQVFAARRPGREQPFGPPEPVSPPEAAQNPAVAYDPSTRQPLIAWSATPGAPNGFVEGSGGRPAPRSLSLARFVP
jgi:hypothetical protein